jgi:glycosyltransferase involved in cell wall biosynthesis
MTVLPAASINLSVALVTRNRPESLRRTLSSLRVQSVQPAEVVVSDDSTGESAESVRELALAFGCRYVRGPRRGLYANRNSAALACKGTHIRTMDDDHEFPPGHLSACMDAIAYDAESIWIIGEFVPGRDRIGDGPPPCPGELDARGYSGSPTDPSHCWAIADGSSIYPRFVFERGVRYEQEIPFGQAYLELGSRLSWLKYRIRFLDTTYVIHHDAGQSITEHGIHLTSRIFASLCHAFIYQPTLKNRLLCSLEIARQLAGGGSRAIGPIGKGFSLYRKRRREGANGSFHA